VIKLFPECLIDFYTEQYQRFHLNEYDERRWLPIGIKGRIDSESSLAAATSVSSFSQGITPEMLRSTVEPESTV
jgi:hypothetical protein